MQFESEWFRVTEKDGWEYTNDRGESSIVRKGQIVSVGNVHTATKLYAEGKIVPRNVSTKVKTPEQRVTHPRMQQIMSGKLERTLRVGIWMQTSTHYSGGRLHMYQMAWSIANAGGEAYLVTNTTPRWARDYPKCERLHVLIDEKDLIPEDIDIVITDSKGSLGSRALAWAKARPWTKFVCVNFETPNWVEQYVPAYAKRLTQQKDVFREASLVICNSDESATWYREWIGTDCRTFTLYPAVNTTAIDDRQIAAFVPPTTRPYVVWSARDEDYKNGDLVVRSVFDLPMEYDVVTIGTYRTPPQPTAQHAVHMMEGITDAEKFALMAKARMVLAPSLFEGAGMVPMEALACGTPCLVYNLPVLREIYGKRLTLVDWGDDKKFRTRVRSYAKSNIRTKVLDEEDAKEARERYGMEAMRKQLVDMPYVNLGRKRVGAHMLAYWGFLPQSIESIYSYVDQIEVAFGPTEITPKIDDGSLDRLMAVPDPDHKIFVQRDTWKCKAQMRTVTCDRLDCNYMILLDGDEVWAGLGEWLAADIPFGTPRWVNFWHDTAHWIHDAPGAAPRWGQPLDDYGSACHHYRCSHWRRSYYWKHHACPTDRTGVPLTSQTDGVVGKVPQCCIYHFGHALPPEVMRAKHQFYEARDGANPLHRDAWHNWDGKVGPCPDGIVKEVNWELPELVLAAAQ